MFRVVYSKSSEDGETGSRMHVVTSDQELAIRGGLQMSQLHRLSVHFFCTLHVKWNVRDHACGSSIFGVEAAERWSHLMQWADGPRSFEQGYRRMCEKYSDDQPRLDYIHELYRDPQKAHFKRRLRFCNAVLVDVCECFFSALKRWVKGTINDRVSLLMSIVRIVEGCRIMILKTYLKNHSVTWKHIVRGSDPAPVKKLFKHCVKKVFVVSLVVLFENVGLCKSCAFGCVFE